MASQTLKRHLLFNMNYCVYNRELDQFLHLTYSYNELGIGMCCTKWINEFVYVLANPVNNFIPRVETAWPEDIKDQLGNYFIFVYNRVEGMNNSKNGMEDVKLIPVTTDGVPDFEREYDITENIDDACA